MHMVRPISVDATVLDSTSVAETETLWNSGTTYGAAAAVYRVIGNVHQRFVSAQASNTNHTPETDDGTWWVDEGPTNRWAMFDDTTTTVTSDSDEIEVVLQLAAGERADTVYLAGLVGATVRIQVEDPAEGTVYDETFSLADAGAILDWYAWYFDPLERKRELLVTDLPSGAASTLTVTITNTGETAECGHLVLGFRRWLGDTRWGVRTEIRDYTRWVENDYGDRVLIPGAYRKLATCEFILENRVKDAVERELTGARAEARLYIANENYTTLAIFGTAKWAVEMSMPPSRSLCSLQIEGNT